MFIFRRKKDSFFCSSTYLLKLLHRDSCSISLIILSCKLVLYSLSKVLFVCWSFSYCFLYLLYFYINISTITILVVVIPHAVPVDIGITMKPIAVRDNVKEFLVVAILTNVSNDSNNLVIILFF